MNRARACCGVLMIVVTLSSCAYQLTLMPRDSGTRYYGKVTEDGTVTITIDARTYTGQWVRTSQPYSYTFLPTGVAQTVGGTVTRTAILTSADGQGLRCEFSGGPSQGGGLCMDDRGRVFDVQYRVKSEPS